MSTPSSSLSGFYSYTDTLKGVHYGPGSVGTALPKLLDTIGGKKALVVTGKSLFTAVLIFPPSAHLFSFFFCRRTLLRPSRIF